MLDDPSELQAVGRLWAGAKVEVELAPNLLRARWAKLCWNMPFNGLTTILGTLGAGRQTDERWGSSGWRAVLLVRDVLVTDALDRCRGVSGGVSVDHVVRTPELRSLSMKVMHDVIRAANAELALQAPPPDGSSSSQWAIEQSFHDLMYELTDKMVSQPASHAGARAGPPGQRWEGVLG